MPRVGVDRVRELDVPLTVRLGSTRLSVGQVMGLTPGAILELSSRPEDPLEIYAGGKCIGVGEVVKVGENYGIRVGVIGSDEAIQAVVDDTRAAVEAVDTSAEAMAEALLSGRG